MPNLKRRKRRRTAKSKEKERGSMKNCLFYTKPIITLLYQRMNRFFIDQVEVITNFPFFNYDSLNKKLNDAARSVLLMS
ncbi:hypothetical protein DS031_19255 [Bacillus taeanensis]|uniref:Uncharacterized protein n=1 Tax=Bacillus taeanensis TaxID=273032 RepID=A0A366XQF6_9BACI|nr:hypothetical protein DS031_19255 [Bacillus taeanensis]